MDQENSRKIITKDEKDAQILSDYEDIINSGKLSRLNSSNPNLMLKKLFNPKFIGSYHLKNRTDQRFRPLSDIIGGKYELKYVKSLKSLIFNPLTIVLIILALGFNLFWLFLLLF